MYFVDCTGTVGATLPLGPTTPDCWVAASLFGLGQISGLDGICCVGACATAPCHCGNTGVLTLPSLLISSSSMILIVPCALILDVAHTAPRNCKVLQTARWTPNWFPRARFFTFHPIAHDTLLLPSIAFSDTSRQRRSLSSAWTARSAVSCVLDPKESSRCPAHTGRSRLP